MWTQLKKKNRKKDEEGRFWGEFLPTRMDIETEKDKEADNDWEQQLRAIEEADKREAGLYTLPAGSLTHSLTHSLTYSLTHSLTYSLTHSLTYFLRC